MTTPTSNVNSSVYPQELTVLKETENAYVRKPQVSYDEKTGEWSFELLGQKIIVVDGYYDDEDVEDYEEYGPREPRNVHGELSTTNGIWYLEIDYID